MKSKAKFVILLFCSTVVLLYWMFFNEALTSPWRPGLYFVHAVISSNLSEGEQPEEKTSEAQPTDNTVVQFDIKVQEDIIKLRLVLQNNYSKIQDKVTPEKSTQQPQTFAMFAARKNLIILSPGRGGSSFLGEIFNSSPRVMYWFEPLHTVISKLFNVSLFIEGIEPETYKETSISVINSLFDCNYSDISDFTLSALSSSPFRKQSRALTSGYLCPNKCLPFSKPLLSKACNAYNHTVIKIFLTDRVPNKTIETLGALFQQPERYDVKLVHLVRDPRAVVHSMVNSVEWIKNHLDPHFRENVHRICDPIVQNMRFGLLNPPPWLKNRFKVIRYEDLVFNSANIARELYRFAGFDWSSSVDKWIDRHGSQVSKTEAKNPYSLYRNTSVVIDKWKNAPEAFIETVEDICGDLMDILGYEKRQKAR